MSRPVDTHLFLDLLESGQTDIVGTELIENNDTSSLQTSYQQYRAIAGLERCIACEHPTLSDDVSRRILEPFAEFIPATDTQPSVTANHETSTDGESIRSLRRCYHRLLCANAAVTLLLLFTIIRLLPDSVVEPAQIPTGHSFVAFEVAMEPERIKRIDYVDIRVRYPSLNNEYQRELGRFIAVHHVDEVTDSAIARSRVTLVLPERQVELIRLAQVLGELEISPVVSPVNSTYRSQPVLDPLGRVIPISGTQAPAVLYLNSGGETARHVYRNGTWIEDAPVTMRAF